MYNVTSEEKTLGGALYLVSLFTIFIGPLIIWYLKRDSQFINDTAKEYANFIISHFIYQLVCFILAFVLIGVFLSAILGVVLVVFTIIAAVKAFDGQVYRIPFVIRFIR